MTGWHRSDRHRPRGKRSTRHDVEETLRAEGERLREEIEGWALGKMRRARRRLRPDVSEAERSEEDRARKATEEAYREARNAVARRLGFYAHFFPYAATCLFLVFVAGIKPALIVAFWWGFGVAIHGFFALVAPELRRRWTEDEMQRRLPVEVAHERRELADRHARNLETLSASIAHEIRNPITAAKSLLQQMGEDPHSVENVEYAAVALQELERVERSISHLLRYARDEELRPQPVTVAEVVRSALDTLRERVERSQVTLRVDADEAGTVLADPEKLRRVVINLVGNALDALEGQTSPPPRVDLEAGENLAGTEVWLRIRDNGPGIPAERLSEIWTPFRTSKANGTGLGLPITRKLVEAHGGAVEVHSAPGNGSEFLVTLPRKSLTEAAR
jgi:signal transduction histidine kinase